ncbi:MAG TPA: hypothetical protein VEC60_15145, partial [Reyranella sp.]|nr:hypothetical protein [Reyranella sp.]
MANHEYRKPLPIDETLRQWATDKQWEDYVTYRKTGSKLRAAEALGKRRETVQGSLRALYKKAALHGYAPDQGLERKIPPGFAITALSTTYDGEGEIERQSVQAKPEGADKPFVEIPDPKKVSRTTTLFDRHGDVALQWVQEKPQDAAREAAWFAFAEGLASKIVPAAPIAPPKFSTDDQLTVYGVGDHHMGMLAWGKETGGDPYDLKISERLLSDAVSYLTSSVPATRQALMMFLGDFTHTDGYAPLTPASGHLLDADSRFPKIAEAAGRAMVNAIDLALVKHESVTVIVTAGNHDPVSAIWLRIALRAHYKNEARVTIDMEPKKFHYFEWGKNLVGSTHGDRIKIDNLPAIMATDMPEAWGRTLHRFWLTGHVHHDKVKDLVGAKVISVRVLAPADAYTANSGYRTPRDMKAMILHREFGESG